MSDLKIIVQGDMIFSNESDNIVLPLYLDYGGYSFPNSRWTDFADILNMWSFNLLKQTERCSGAFVLYFMDGPYWLDVTMNNKNLTIKCVNDRKEVFVERTITCTYIELLKAVHEAINSLSELMRVKGLNYGRYESVYKQFLVTSKKLEEAMSKCN